jgi:hypothetical protein
MSGKSREWVSRRTSTVVAHADGAKLKGRQVPLKARMFVYIYTAIALIGGFRAARWSSNGFAVGLLVAFSIFVALIAWPTFFHPKTRGSWVSPKPFVLLAFGFGSLLVIYQWLIVPEITLRRFTESVPGYVAVASQTPPIETQPARLIGKLLPINLNGGRIDPFLFQLPQELRATDPSQVGTIVGMRCGSTVVGKYGNLGSASVMNCIMQLWKSGTGEFLGSATFSGPPPPQYSAQSVTGPVPLNQMVQYLVALPRLAK